jgi:hypothetical protein
MFNWKKPTLILTLLFIFLILFKYISTIREDYVPKAYEKELIAYFKEIALQSEYGGNPEKVIKWKEPMVLFVFKEQEFGFQISTIKKIIQEINQLTTDGFKIRLTDDFSNSNSVLYLCDKEKVAELNKHFYEMFGEGIDYEIAVLHI